MQDKEILKVENLTISFPAAETFVAVDNISFSLDAGKTLAIVGESGSGKSLTALALMGLLPAAAVSNGSIGVRNSETNFSLLTEDNVQWRRYRGKAAGMVFQEPMSSLNPVMKIGEQLTEAIRNHQNLNKKQASALAINWLQKVHLPNPENIFLRYPHQLSGGQKQRVMIAIAMCNHPALLIADEPTTALDVTVQQEVVNLMGELQRQTGTALIFITHDLALAGTLADDVLVMYKGKVVEQGKASVVLKNPEHPYTKALIACRPSPERKGKRLPVVSDFLAEVNDIDTAAQENIKVTITDNVLLEAKNVRVWFTEEKSLLGKPLSYFKAVDDVSFQLHKGEVLGLVGESGCGKSTLSRSLIGLTPIHSGEVFFDGKNISNLSLNEWRKLRTDIQMIFQDPFSSLNPRMTVGEMLAEPLKVHNIVPRKDVKAEVKRLLDIVHLPENAMHRYPHQFSGGQRQRLGIARALSVKPKLLICDESVSALDVSVQAQVLNLLKELQYEFGLSYLFISHDLTVVHYISDRVLVMQAGKIVERGAANDVLQHPQQAYTQQLVAAIPSGG